MAEQAAIGQDIIDFANLPGLERFALAGFDWGSRTACITSILHPGRMRAQVAIGGYSVQNTVVPSFPGWLQPRRGSGHPAQSLSYKTRSLVRIGLTTSNHLNQRTA